MAAPPMCPPTRLERRMEAAQSIRTQDNVAHSRVNHHQLLLGNWNTAVLFSLFHSTADDNYYFFYANAVYFKKQQKKQ